MVTPQGFNALLKLVEEPPEHVKFIFATTEPDKVLGTIRSRTHHYPFRLVPPAPMLEYVQQLCAEEGVEVAAGRAAARRARRRRLAARHAVAARPAHRRLRGHDHRLRARGRAARLHARRAARRGRRRASARATPPARSPRPTASCRPGRTRAASSKTCSSACATSSSSRRPRADGGRGGAARRARRRARPHGRAGRRVRLGRAVARRRPRQPDPHRDDRAPPRRACTSSSCSRGCSCRRATTPSAARSPASSGSSAASASRTPSVGGSSPAPAQAAPLAPATRALGRWPVSSSRCGPRPRGRRPTRPPARSNARRVGRARSALDDRVRPRRARPRPRSPSARSRCSRCATPGPRCSRRCSARSAPRGWSRSPRRCASTADGRRARARLPERERRRGLPARRRSRPERRASSCARRSPTCSASRSSSSPRVDEPRTAGAERGAAAAARRAEPTAGPRRPRRPVRPRARPVADPERCDATKAATPEADAARAALRDRSRRGDGAAPARSRSRPRSRGRIARPRRDHAAATVAERDVGADVPEPRRRRRRATASERAPRSALRPTSPRAPGVECARSRDRRRIRRAAPTAPHHPPATDPAAPADRAVDSGEAVACGDRRRHPALRRGRRARGARRDVPRRGRGARRAPASGSVASRVRRHRPRTDRRARAPARHRAEVGAAHRVPHRADRALRRQPARRDPRSRCATRCASATICGNVSEQETCAICRDPRRDPALICVVEEAKDVVAIERTREFRGLYHVLGGAISPIDGIGPDELRIRQLMQRLADGTVTEVIIATDPNLEGEATATYLSRLLTHPRDPCHPPRLRACPSAATSSTPTRSRSAARSRAAASSRTSRDAEAPSRAVSSSRSRPGDRRHPSPRPSRTPPGARP